MARKLIIVQFLGLLIMVSCGDRGKSLYPLRESEKWTYQAVPDSAMSANARMTVTNMPERNSTESLSHHRRPKLTARHPFHSWERTLRGSSYSPAKGQTLRDL